MTRCRSGNEAIHLRASHACVGGNAPPLPRRFVAVSALLLMLSCAPLAARAESDSSNVEVGDSSTAVDDAALGNVIEATASGNSSAQCAGDQPPFADAGDSYSGYTNTTITFDGSDSYDNDGDVLGWRWRFGDGTMYPPVRSDGHVYWSSSPIVTHKYTQPGTYTLELWVIDDCLGISPIATAAVTITNPEPCGGCPEGLYCDEASGSCVQCLSDAHCDNGLFCDGQETCNEYGQCESGDEPCAGYDYCVEESDSCANCLSDDDCDNGLFCDGQETCNSGACIDGTAPCTADQECDEDADECVTLAECQTDDDCNDDIFCNGPELCIDGECQAGTPPCNAGQTCNEETQSCDNIDDSLIYYSPYNPPRRTSVAFSVTDSGLRDGNAFYYWMFSDGKYKYGQTCSRSFDADGSYSVTLTVYDSTTWLVLDSEEKSICVGSDCESAPECLADSDCDNGEYCDGQERCQNGQCVNGAAPCAEDELCDEDTDSCDPAPECETDADCANGNFCAGERTCVNGECQDGDSPCAYDEICDENSDSCVECLTHDDCSGDLLCSDSKTCVECLGDEDCPTGEACDLDANTCGVQAGGEIQGDLTILASLDNPWPGWEIHFTASGSATTFPNAFYYWLFDDGSISYEPSVSRSFSQTGNRYVELTIYDSADWSEIAKTQLSFTIMPTLKTISVLEEGFGYASCLEVDEETAWIGAGAAGTGTLASVDVSNPANPALIATMPLAYAPTQIAKSGWLLAVAAGTEVLAFEVDENGDSSVLGNFNAYALDASYVAGVAVYQNYIFVACGSNLKVLEASASPPSLQLVNTVDIPLASRLLLNGTILYGGLSDYHSLAAVDVSAPVAASFPVNTVATENHVYDLAIEGSVLAIVERMSERVSGLGSLAVFDLSAPDAPQLRTRLDSTNKFRRVCVSEGHVYATSSSSILQFKVGSGLDLEHLTSLSVTSSSAESLLAREGQVYAGLSYDLLAILEPYPAPED